MKAKKVKKVEGDVCGPRYSDMIEGRLMSGCCPMPIHKILSSLREYQAIQRGGYWKHDQKKDIKRIKEWHRAIDAAIYIVDAVAKTETMFKMWNAVVKKGDYPMVVPSEKSVRMDEMRILGIGNCKIVGRAVERKTSNGSGKLGHKHSLCKYSESPSDPRNMTCSHESHKNHKKVTQAECSDCEHFFMKDNRR